ncbi:hypothetical protein R3X28_17955 [Maribacter sp. TH_r10]|uniref:hypothetical protein n=1 Tax=Maribacter sp. TH_r10 TaxID=3082086 RepID=UPI0029553408|nr:hypothetical protein [Maribacter sp. TH_r10]MDV7140782.1 hypothetical protein [Maribacter sp. TH_r10]
MEKKKINYAKVNIAFGILAVLGGIALMFLGQFIMGISGAVIGAIAAISGLKLMK